MLKHGHPDMRVSPPAMAVLNDITTWLLATLVEASFEYSIERNSSTTSDRHSSDAVATKTAASAPHSSEQAALELSELEPLIETEDVVKGLADLLQEGELLSDCQEGIEISSERFAAFVHEVQGRDMAVLRLWCDRDCVTDMPSGVASAVTELEISPGNGRDLMKRLGRIDSFLLLAVSLSIIYSWCAVVLLFSSLLCR